MRVLRAVAKALAAMTMLIAVWCEQLCRFFLKCLPGYQPPTPEDVVEMYHEAAETKQLDPDHDAKIAGIQAAADALFRQQPVPGQAVKGLSDKTLDWLELLDADQLLTVAQAKPEVLSEHLALRQQIRGLLRYEQDAMDAYREAVEADLRVPKRPSPKRDREDAANWSLPAFGPIC